MRLNSMKVFFSASARHSLHLMVDVWNRGLHFSDQGMGICNAFGTRILLMLKRSSFLPFER